MIYYPSYIFYLVVKHRIPSPTREAGDGMEATKSSNNSPNSTITQETPGAKLIKLPQTNIALEKLPPITDDKVKLPVTEPTSPLVPVSFRFFSKDPEILLVYFFLDVNVTTDQRSKVSY